MKQIADTTRGANLSLQQYALDDALIAAKYFDSFVDT